MDAKSLLLRHLHESQFRLLQDIRYEAHLQFENFKNLIFPARRAKRKSILAMENARLHFGCGTKRLDGWLNVDGWDSPAVDYVHDLRRPLPLPDDSVSLIFTEHVIEHFHYRDGSMILRDFYRILRVGGAIRIIVPDLTTFARNYLNDDKIFMRDIWSQCRCSGDVLNYIFYGHFHRATYDYEMLRIQLQSAGFKNIRKAAFRDSAIPDLNVDSDLPSRVDLSVYVEAVK